MKFLRGLIVVPTFLAFPIALMLFAGLTYFQDQLPNLMEQTSEDILDDTDMRQALIVEVVDGWLVDHPTFVGEDPFATASAIIRTDAFAELVQTGASEAADGYRGGDLSDLSFDLTPAIEEARLDMTERAYTQLIVSPMFEVDSASTADLMEARDTVELVRARSLWVAGAAMILLVAASKRPRSVPAALTFIGGPLVAFQVFIVAIITSSGDAIDVYVADLWASAWTSFLFAAGALVVVSAILFFRLAKGVLKAGSKCPSRRATRRQHAERYVQAGQG